MKTLLSNAATMHDKIVVVKSIANAALPELLPVLEKLIIAETEEVLVKKYAIYALNNFTEIAPTKIQKVLLPIFLDVTKPAEIRMACVDMILSTKPSLPLMTIMTKALNTEPSHEVGSFLFTKMAAMAKDTCMLK